MKVLIFILVILSLNWFNYTLKAVIKVFLYKEEPNKFLELSSFIILQIIGILASILIIYY
jgi:hypothetical protein